MQCIILVFLITLIQVSMLSANTLDNLEKICRGIRGIEKYFGGLQVILCGDFYQLPPVPSAIDPGHYAFKAKCFKDVFPHVIVLKSVYRQNDQELIQVIIM